MARQFKSSDTDADVLDADGERIGTIQDVKGGVAHVKPASRLSQSMRRKLGWEGEEEMYELRSSRVDRFDDDGVHLRKI